jgi:ATP-binding cassette, subfamily C, bacterial LapB
MSHGSALARQDILKPDDFRTSVFSLLLCTLAINVLSLALPVMTLQVYDRILPNPGTGTLPVLVVGVCLAVFLEAGLRLSRAYVIGRSGVSYEHRMACNAMQRVLFSDLTKLNNYGVGRYLQKIGSVGKLKDFYNGYSLTVFVELAFLPIFLGLIIYIGQWLAVVPVTILIVFSIVSLLQGQKLQGALKNREDSDEKRFNFLIESLEGVHTLKAFALENFFARRYEDLEERSTFDNFKVTQKTSSLFNTVSIFSHIMVASVITAGAWYVLNGYLTTGGLIAVLLLSGRMMQPVQKAVSLWARYQDFQRARDNMTELLTTPQREIIERPHPLPILAEGRLEIKNLSFRYSYRDEPILKDINLDLTRGKSILISGTHGSGKSTLLSLIAGIYLPEAGNILIDGEDIRSYNPADLSRHIGFIRSEAIIFRGTIRDNITCFGQNDEAQAREVADLLHVDREVAQLPGGFDTFLNGNNTDVISPGLKQRIAMLRVLATKPRLILFDNADRTLDREGYARIYSLLARLRSRVSMVIVSDDRNLRGLTDEHFTLENGILTPNTESYSRGNVRPYKELRL